MSRRTRVAFAAALALVLGVPHAGAAARIARRDDGLPKHWWICVSNERSGDLTLFDGGSRRRAATVRLGKRPRGVHASPDGRWLYVALSGSPIEGPPGSRTGTPGPADRAADGIGVVDLHHRRLVRVLQVGADPEEFALSRDGRRLYVANEDAGTLSIVRVADGVIEHTTRVGPEPEGVELSPGGARVYVTCEGSGAIWVVDATTGEESGHFAIRGRPRSLAFTPDGARAFVPSETSGQVFMFDVAVTQLLATADLAPGSRPMKVLLDGDGHSLWVSNGRGHTVTRLDPNTLAVRRTIRAGERPWGMAFSPDERWLYVANGPSDDVSVIDTHTDREVARLRAGEGPWGVAVVPK